MKFKIAPDSQSHVIELAVLAGLSAGITILANNLASLNLGPWSAAVASGLTIVLSIIKNLEQ